MAGQTPTTMARCVWCGKTFDAPRGARYCSNACWARVASARARGGARPILAPAEREKSVRRALDAIEDGVPYALLEERFSGDVVKEAYRRRRKVS